MTIISAQVIADTYFAGARLTTVECVYPRFIHSEVLTHRAFSRNAASSRAIPISKMLEAVRTGPAMPISWGKNQKGMSASEDLEGDSLAVAMDTWLKAAEDACKWAHRMELVGAHKQVANRLLEPFMHMQTLISATEWTNFFALRTASDVQPEFQALAKAILDAMNSSTPVMASADGYWHLPYLSDEERLSLDPKDQKKVSVARCARVSYTKQGLVKELQDDRQRHDEAVAKGHWSPFEHVAMTSLNSRRGNFKGFLQYRHTFPTENIETFEGLQDPFKDIVYNDDDYE